MDLLAMNSCYIMASRKVIHSTKHIEHVGIDKNKTHEACRFAKKLVGAYRRSAGCLQLGESFRSVVESMNIRTKSINVGAKSTENDDKSNKIDAKSNPIKRNLCKLTPNQELPINGRIIELGEI